MGERGYSWIFPLIGGLLAIGALFTPAAYHITNDVMYDGIYIWMWGLIIYDGYIHGAIFIFQREPEFFLSNLSHEFYGIFTSMISTFGILLSGIGLIITAKKVKNQRMKPKVASVLWVIFSLILIAVAIFWIITASIYYSDLYLPRDQLKYENNLFEDEDFTFWAYFNPGFCLIGVFIAAGISLIGDLIKYKYNW